MKDTAIIIHPKEKRSKNHDDNEFLPKSRKRHKYELWHDIRQTRKKVGNWSSLNTNRKWKEYNQGSNFKLETLHMWLLSSKLLGTRPLIAPRACHCSSTSCLDYYSNNLNYTFDDLIMKNFITKEEKINAN